MHACKMYACKMYACKMYAYEVYTYEVYTRDFDFRKILIYPLYLAVLVGHITVLGGMRWCVMVPPNGSGAVWLISCIRIASTSYD
jgi:hypothetical protein